MFSNNITYRLKPIPKIYHNMKMGLYPRDKPANPFILATRLKKQVDSTTFLNQQFCEFSVER